MQTTFSKEQSTSDDILSKARKQLEVLIHDINESNIILVLDKTTAKNLRSFVQLHNLFENGIFLVEELSKKRKPFPKYCVVYLIYSIVDSLDIIAHDINPKKPSYRSAYIYYIEPPPESFWERYAQPLSNPLIKSIRQTFFSFQCEDTFALHFNAHLDLACLMSNSMKEECQKASKILSNVLKGMNYTPSIRFQQSVAAKAVALNVMEYTKVPYEDLDGKQWPRCELLILDRTLDVCSPIIHDYAYENLLRDFCDDLIASHDLGVDHLHWDTTWRTIRHLNIEDARSHVKKVYENFKELQQLKKSSSLGNTSNSMLVKVIHETAEQQKFVKEVEFHMSALNRIFERMEEVDFVKVFEVEQALICFLRTESSQFSVEEILRHLKEIMRSKVSSNAKFRVLLLFSLTQIGENNKRLEELLEFADIPRRKISTIHKIQSMRNLSSKTLNELAKKATRERRCMFSRCPTVLKQVTELAIKGTLPVSDFPYATAQSTGVTSSGAQSYGVSDTFVYMVGGFCTAEMHDIRNLMSSQKKAIFLGGTSHVSPESFIDQVELIPPM
ncbi:ROP-like protein [Perkinsela sp. CCAP 1560/4]|nr:ROP-like protein [Perkinsela sp. CCAP 1560/4]|eukprot:KNH09401.1 ROP-like protein [Perkinsela sp. CCAP 1560/4]